MDDTQQMDPSKEYDCLCYMKNAKPQTSDGMMVINELSIAITNGVITKQNAQKLTQHVIASENENKSVLVAKTPQGQAKMNDIIQAVSTGQISNQQAKQMASKVIVSEAIQGHEQVYDVSPMDSMMDDHGKIDNMSSQSVKNSSLASMANEVKKRTIETVSKGVPLSQDNMKQICLSVMTDHQQKCSEMDKEMYGNEEVNGVDPNSSNYGTI